MARPWCVIVGIDFSDASQRALDVAVEVSAQTAAPLKLVHVWHSHRPVGTEPIPAGVEYWFRDQKDLLLEKLSSWAADASSSGPAAIPTVLEGLASQAIPDFARSQGGGLIVVGRRGAANLSYVLLGSVSERLSVRSTSPVLVVPDVGVRFRSPERLLVGVDFSDTSKLAYQEALSMAKRVRAPRGLLLAHVSLNARELALEDRNGAPQGEDHPYDVDSLQRWADTPERGDIVTESRILEGNVATALLSEADESGCDWIVIGVQGRTALGAMWMGGTTDRVLKLTDRPVMVVPRSASNGAT